MNRLLGYEPYQGFEIYAFPAVGKDILDRPFDGYRGWAKRTSDGKCFDGGAIHRTITEMENEMRTCIDIILTYEEKKANGETVSGVAPTTLFGFR